MKLKAIIEIPAGSRFKYEHHGGQNPLVLDRPLNQAIPYNYGYIPNTLEDDGDALDLFVLTDLPIYPLTAVTVEIVSVIKCMDNGQRDDKIIATLVGDCNGYETMGTAVIHRYLESYKTGFEIIGVGNKEEAIQIYEESLKRYADNRIAEEKGIFDVRNIKNNFVNK